MKKRKVGVLISGRGSNLHALIGACAQEDFPAEIALVISNVADAGGLEHAAAAGIPTLVIAHGKFPSREAFDSEMDSRLKAAGVEFVCLAGFMRLLSTPFVKEWEGKMINIHPSLLPSFEGLHVHERMIEAGVKLAGCTVHFVTEGVDEGPIIIQAAVPIVEGDTPETLAARILVEEHKIYPEAVQLFAEGRLKVDGRIVRVSGAAG